ncbi:hypothetical protein ACFL03_08030 [Thermodesulfobacteriota bacterium]
MKKLKDQLKSISRSLTTLSKQVDKALKEVDTLKPAKAAPVRKKKVAAKKTVAKRKAPAKKAAPRKKAPARQITLLDTVFNAIKMTQKGVTIAKLKEKTKLDPRQLSNALYKLSNKGLIVAKARGLYAKK